MITAIPCQVATLSKPPAFLRLDTNTAIAFNQETLRGNKYGLCLHKRFGGRKFLGVIEALPDGQWKATHYERALVGAGAYSDKITLLDQPFDSYAEAAQALASFAPDEQAKAQSELNADLEKQAQEIAPEPDAPTNERYTVSKRWEMTGYWYFVRDEESLSKSCIGHYSQTLSKDGWIINSVIIRDSRVFATAADAQKALILDDSPS